jgi:hypothetical protein
MEKLNPQVRRPLFSVKIDVSLWRSNNLVINMRTVKIPPGCLCHAGAMPIILRSSGDSLDPGLLELENESLDEEAGRFRGWFGWGKPKNHHGFSEFFK